MTTVRARKQEEEALLPLTLFVAPGILAAIKQIAIREDRSQSQVGHRLLRKALNGGLSKRNPKSRADSVKGPA
jgi:hypothetical protein